MLSEWGFEKQRREIIFFEKEKPPAASTTMIKEHSKQHYTKSVPRKKRQSVLLSHLTPQWRSWKAKDFHFNFGKFRKKKKILQTENPESIR